jgi:hypothetical protein
MGSLPQDDKSMVLSLVRDWALTAPETLSVVPSYTTIRWVGRGAVSVPIGGHVRRKALYTRLLSSVQGTCKLQELTFPVDRTRKRTRPEEANQLKRQHQEGRRAHPGR